MGHRPEAGGPPSRKEGFGPAAGNTSSRAPREDWNSHLLRGHPAMRASVSEGLAVHFHDARRAITSGHREDLSDPLPHDLRVTAPEESGRDGLFAIEEEERIRIAAIEMLLHSIGLIGVEECEPGLPGYRVPQ